MGNVLGQVLTSIRREEKRITEFHRCPESCFQVRTSNIFYGVFPSLQYVVYEVPFNQNLHYPGEGWVCLKSPSRNN